MKVKYSEIGRVVSRIPVWMSQAETLLFREGPVKLTKRGGRKLYRYLFYHGDPHRMHRFNYGDWMKNIEDRYLNKEYMQRLSTKLNNTPKFSVIIPVWNKPVAMIEKALESVVSQYYENWELCISDGSSENIEETMDFLKDFERKNRGKVTLGFLSDDLRKRINIIENRNNCLEMATGEYCVIVDADDELAPNCLLELAWQVEKTPDVSFIYSDFDKIDTGGRRSDPSFWPGWSPHTILSMMYTTHVRCIRTDLFRELGGMREGTEGADDWDLVLRLSEKVKPDQIQHIPKILYHWRLYPGSTAMSNSGVKDWAYANQKKILEDWMKRDGSSGTVEKGMYEGSWRVRFAIKGEPKVSILVPFRDGAAYTRKCVESIEKKTDYRNYEIVLIDNRSEGQETKEFLDSVRDRHTVLSYDHPYSFGKLNNWAARQVDGEHLLMLNNDTEVIDGGWLRAMLEYSQRKEVGAVGAKLLYPDGRIQHAGIIVGLGGAAAHSHRLLKGDMYGYNGWLVNVLNVLAVTGACLMIKKDLFLHEMGGFSPEFDPAYQDVDLGIRLYEAGYWNVFTPYARLYHYESVTRMNPRNKGQLTKDEENAERLREKWSKYVGVDFCNDPFYNPNLSCSHEDFRIRNTWYPEDWGKRMGLVV